MNKQQWTHLAEAVNRAAVARGLTRKQLAMFAGCTGAMVGNALNGKFNMSEEKWRMVCERLMLDYDGIMAGGNGELVRDAAEDTTNVDMEQELRCVIEDLCKEVEQERVRAVEAEARVIQEVERREEAEGRVIQEVDRREAAEEQCRKLEGKLDGERERYHRQASELEELQQRHDALEERAAELTSEARQLKEELDTTFRRAQEAYNDLHSKEAELEEAEEELAQAKAKLEEMEQAVQVEREQIRKEIWREAEAYVEQHRQETSRALLTLKAKLYDLEHPELGG